MRTAIAAVVTTAVVSLTLAACVAPPPATPDPAPPATAPPTTAPPTWRQSSTNHRVGGCNIFGVDHYMNATNIDRLAVHRDSNRWIAHLGGASKTLNAPSPTVWEGSRSGMPINVVDSRQVGFVQVLLNQSWTPNHYTGGYPIGPSPKIEGHPGAAWDRHLLTVDTADCNAYELIQYDNHLAYLGIHAALSGTRYPLTGTAFPPTTTNSTNTPMIGQYVMVDDAIAGQIRYPVSWCTDISGPGHTWPARASDGPSTAADAPPQGAWLRLRSSVDRSRFTGQARAIVDGLRRHGMVLTDTCGHRLSLFTENSDRWNRDEMNQLETLTVADFEAVDPTPMIVSGDSWKIR